MEGKKAPCKRGRIKGGNEEGTSEWRNLASPSCLSTSACFWTQLIENAAVLKKIPGSDGGGSSDGMGLRLTSGFSNSHFNCGSECMQVVVQGGGRALVQPAQLSYRVEGCEWVSVESDCQCERDKKQTEEDKCKCTSTLAAGKTAAEREKGKKEQLPISLLLPPNEETPSVL